MILLYEESQATRLCPLEEDLVLQDRHSPWYQQAINEKGQSKWPPLLLLIPAYRKHFLRFAYYRLTMTFLYNGSITRKVLK
jgi:hypothetical protein